MVSALHLEVGREESLVVSHPAMLRRRAAHTNRARHIQVSVPDVPADEVEALVVKARRIRTKGDDRKATQLLRTACLLDEWRPHTFEMLGAWLLEAGHRDEARARLRHARWLHVRAGDEASARDLDALIAAAAEAA
jgi:Flp pilus assembly protein TadD